MANKKVFISVLSGVAVLIFSGCILYGCASFGSLSKSGYQDSIKKSPNYQNGEFHNPTDRPDLTEGISTWKAFWDFTTGRNPRGVPKDSIPAIHTDIKALPSDHNYVIWFGHSSSYLQLNGKHILIDPVFSENGSPVWFINKAFRGTDIFHPADFPEIDVLLISHDHYDHLDYPTVKALQPKVKIVICGLGTGAHFRKWGYRKDQIIEMDWYNRHQIDSSLSVILTPAHHNSGRGLKMKQALWASFVIESPSYKVFYSGDSGYDVHFQKIGERYGPFDLALIECGQYDPEIKYMHMQPKESLQAAFDVRAKMMLPVHWGKFNESRHAWDDPIIQITGLARRAHLSLFTPVIGQAIDLGYIPKLKPWWQGIN